VKLKLSDWIFFFGFGGIVCALALTCVALVIQPKVSDDYHFLWRLQDSPSKLEFIFGLYFQWTGRLSLILLSALMLSSPLIEAAYRSFILFEICALVFLCWYCALGSKGLVRSRDGISAVATFGCLLWFALPARDETVVWLQGNCVYLVPVLLCLSMISWIEMSLRARRDQRLTSIAKIVLASFSFFLGFGAGSSQEQVVASCLIYFISAIPRVRILILEGRCSSLLVFIASLFGFVLGAIALVGAPGNYVRAGVLESPGLVQIFERMVLYLSGALFELGSGSQGKSIWLGGLVFVVLYFRRPIDWRTPFIAGRVWFLMALGSLIAMTPATSFISVRTTFFAVVFLFIGILAASGYYPLARTGANEFSGLMLHDDAGGRASFARRLGFLIVSALVFSESLAFAIANRSISLEMDERLRIVDRAINDPTLAVDTPIVVPFITTQPSPLSYIQTPNHDREFLVQWGKRIGRTIIFDTAITAPLPNSFKPVKSIKFRKQSSD